MPLNMLPYHINDSEFASGVLEVLRKGKPLNSKYSFADLKASDIE